ncbi:serine/threonine-protein kinase [Nocardioides sp. CFH 31398]|uniref:serine/threonine-protein kinase n=1 Tax=Nocardioides sp. CFH 31398 TaxID=2919579 RepID=UPI001F06D38C|nr:serine/threonine-protein kinase [Nocardioides sp. CFH 31398]MCH1869034.1 serine/threonine protein kinase [Nocardioides sp. CFH 31398]
MISHEVSDRYRVVREIGRGGMGAVYLGEDVLLGRSVALKRIGYAPEGPQEVVDTVRAEREARLAAMINHPNVVAVYDLVESGETQWLVMEYVEGTALSDLVEAEGSLDDRRVAGMVAQAADALHAAHVAHVVHRDVKPSNILVTAHDQLKITDFGIARGETDTSLTRTGMVTGSPAYLAPEVASGRSATPASDVWSLGATLFHARTGRAPYAVEDNVLGTLYRIVNDDPPRLAPGDPLATLLEHTMALEPADRWTMAQVRDHARAVASGAVLPGPRATGRPEATQVLTTPPPVEPEPSFLESATRAEPTGPTGPTGPTKPTRRVTTTTSGGGRERSRALPAVVVAVAVVLVALLGLWLGLQGGDDGQEAGGGSSPSAPATTDGGSPSGSGSPSESPSPSESESPEADAADMTAFIEGYLATVTSDPEAAFGELTPGFQSASGGIGGYRGFWDGIASATPSNVSADPDTMTVSYDVDYRLVGGGSDSDQVTLRLELTDDGQYLIAGEN